jgi:hypothetical protein
VKSGIIYLLIGALLCGSITFFVMKKRTFRKDLGSDLQQLNAAELSVKKRLTMLDTKLSAQLSAFSEAVSSDKDFSIKLLVENDKSSSDVVEIAGRYLKAMDFSVLEVVDSSNTIISSGHFPASAGLNDKDHITQLSSEPAAAIENVMGNQLLAFQLKKEFKIADYLFYAVGGIEINDKFFSELAPFENVKVLLKLGNKYIGMNDIRSISEIKDHKIIINDKEYFATQFPFPSVKSNGDALLLVVIEK